MKGARGSPQDESDTADADWFSIPDHAGVGRSEDATAFLVPYLSCLHTVGAFEPDPFIPASSEGNSVWLRLTDLGLEDLIVGHDLYIDLSLAMVNRPLSESSSGCGR